MVLIWVVIGCGLLVGKAKVDRQLINGDEQQCQIVEGNFDLLRHRRLVEEQQGFVKGGDTAYDEIGDDLHWSVSLGDGAGGLEGAPALVRSTCGVVVSGDRLWGVR